jgi:3-oxoacyl-[acyl-carrier-protein] synthase II
MLHMSIDSRRTVVVTGLGVISGCGNDVSSFWDNVAQGRCSIDRVTRFDVSDFPCQIASEVKDFTASDHFNLAKTARTHDAYTHYAVAAAKMAVRDAGLDMETVDKSRVGVIVGSAFGGMATYERETLKLSKGCPRDVSVYTIPALLGNTAAGVIGIEIG